MFNGVVHVRTIRLKIMACVTELYINVIVFYARIKDCLKLAV